MKNPFSNISNLCGSCLTLQLLCLSKWCSALLQIHLGLTELSYIMQGEWPGQKMMASHKRCTNMFSLPNCSVKLLTGQKADAAEAHRRH